MDQIEIRVMTPQDYEQVYQLWTKIKGMGIRSIDDSERNIVRFLERNPNTSFVALDGEQLIGSVLCGHDGRQGCLYHVCVAEKYRNRKIGTKMALCAVEALKKEEINIVNLIAFKGNALGNQFWKTLGWRVREDANMYALDLNQQNKTTFVEGDS